MTKTFTRFVSYHQANYAQPGMIVLGGIAEGSSAWYFEFGSLGFFWARPGATWLEYLLPVSSLEHKIIHTTCVSSVWARDLSFDAWNFHGFH